MVHPHVIEDISKLKYPDIKDVGRKVFELAELHCLRIPTREGFVIKVPFFRDFLLSTGIYEDIERARSMHFFQTDVSTDSIQRLIREKIVRTPIPRDLLSILHKFYAKLAGELFESPVDIFSSKKAEESDLYPKVSGDANTVLKIKHIWAANLDSFTAIAIVKNTNFDLSGKIFTNDKVFDKRLHKEQHLRLSQYCDAIEKHFRIPKEIEFGIKDDKIYITMINPYTGNINKNINHSKIVVSGEPLNPGVVTGIARILHKSEANMQIKKGEILIIPELSSIFYKNIKNAKAVIVDSSLSSSKDKAIYKDNFHIATIEGAGNATRIFRNGTVVTVDGTTGKAYLGGFL